MSKQPSKRDDDKRCSLDRVQESDVTEVTASAGRTVRKFRGKLGDVSGCSSVRENRAVASAHIAVHLATIACVVMLVAGWGDGDVVWQVLQVLLLTSTVLAAFYVRHALILAGKLAWHGFGASTRLLVALGATGFVAPFIIARIRGTASPAVVNSLLGTMAATSAMTIAVLASTLHSPESAYFTAVMSAANRLANPDAIARLKASFAIDTP